MYKNLAVSLLLILSISGCGTTNELKGNYTWENKTKETLYKNVSWTPITSQRLSGLSPKDKITEMKTEKCISDYDTPYIRTEGGLCGIGYWLEINDGKSTTKIDSLEKMKKQFTPIKNEIEAISFVAAISSDLYVIDGIPKGNTAKVDNGYLVNLVHNNTFGCGPHEPTGAIYEISENGTIENLAFEKEPFSLKPEMCVD